ncbi:MAG: YfiR family protein [Candidatus Latescibacterota bacterium]|jgi:hypothetical protein
MPSDPTRGLAAGTGSRRCHARGVPSRRWTAVSLLLAVAFLIVLSPGSSAAQHPSEHQVKAAFLFSLASFVDWPETEQADTLSIGILGQDPFGEAFAPFLDKQIKDRPVRLHRSTRLQELPPCQVLYICPSEARYLPQILAYLGNRSVLTVGETEGLAAAGVMINFYLEENKVRFEINVEAAHRADLKLSAKLLKLARLVEEDRP